jgi:hypothetical protein
MARHRSLAAGVALAAAIVLAAWAAGSAPARDSAPQAATIAIASTTSFRVEVTAERRADPSGAPTAVVTATISKLVRGKWRRTARHTA